MLILSSINILTLSYKYANHCQDTDWEKTTNEL